MKRMVVAAIALMALISMSVGYYWSTNRSSKEFTDSVPNGTIEHIQWYDQVCTVITENRKRAERFSDNPYSRDSKAWLHREMQALQEWTRAGEFEIARERLARLKELKNTEGKPLVINTHLLAARIELAETQKVCGQKGIAPKENIDRLKNLANNNQLSPQKLASQWLEKYVEKLHKDPKICDDYGSKEKGSGLYERSKEFGIDVLTRAGGVITEDLNGDKMQDIVVSSHGFKEQLQIFVGSKKVSGKWENRTEKMGLDGMPGGLNVVQADYNNDGWTDLYISRDAWLLSKGEVPDSLLKNVDGKRFVDVTEKAGLWTEAPTQVAQWQDYNGDGHLDLFVGYESQAKWSMGHSGKEELDAGSSSIYTNHLFKNQGNGTFKEVSEEVGLDTYGFVKGASWGQLVGDEYPDLLLSVYGGENIIYENIEGDDGNRIFRKYKELRNPIFSFPTWVWDINHDGLDDIFIANFRVPMKAEIAPFLGEKPQSPASELFINQGNGQFKNVSKEVGLNKYPMSVMGANFGDIDNDGDFDAFLGTGEPNLERWVPNRLLSWDSTEQQFIERTQEFNLGVMDKGHGISFTDLNRDGRQDIYASFGGWYEADESRNRYFENHIENDNQWVQLKLEGTQSNRSAIGAKVEIKVVTADGKKKSFFHTINSGGSFGANSLTLHAGLGEINAIKEVVVTWPRAGYPKQHYKGVEANQAWHLEESLAEPKRLYDYPLVNP
ncbi:MAG: CRTAC1 family protein, partial [Pseudomonadota bacterium]